MQENQSHEPQRLVTMRNPEYQEMVSVACYAIEHGFDVSYEGCGNLIVRLKRRENEDSSYSF